MMRIPVVFCAAKNQWHKQLVAALRATDDTYLDAQEISW